MQDQLRIGSTNLTPYIVDGSFNVISEDIYESWEDANRVEHRVIVTSKVKGECEIVCSSKRHAITLASLLSIISGATSTTGVTTMGCWVINKNEFKAVNAYVKTDVVRHDAATDGTFVDVIKLTITER